MLAALGIRRYVEARKGRAWVVVLEDRQQVEALAPTISAMTHGEHKVAVTARGDGITISSAAFLPGVAVWEDPVTGSAHTMLIPYWSENWVKRRCLPVRFSARGGDVRCELKARAC